MKIIDYITQDKDEDIAGGCFYMEIVIHQLKPEQHTYKFKKILNISNFLSISDLQIDGYCDLMKYIFNEIKITNTQQGEVVGHSDFILHPDNDSSNDFFVEFKSPTDALSLNQIEWLINNSPNYYVLCVKDICKKGYSRSRRSELIWHDDDIRSYKYKISNKSFEKEVSAIPDVTTEILLDALPEIT